MTHVYSDDDGKLLVKLARQTVDEIVQHQRKAQPPQDASEYLWKESGVFVTLNSIEEDSVALRGCIGRPYPTQPLIDATIDSAVDSATRDPRFPPVEPKELDAILVELSVLTPPVKVEYDDPMKLLELVEVGRDGLIVSRGMWRGLLLPQVPVDWKWNVEEYLQHTCNKARLPTDAWKDSQTEFMSFQAEIFGEESPRGTVIRNPSHPRC
ncbi:MAG: TIGR00296 family protein [Candidatus Thorarchaeota archaeon]